MSSGLSGKTALVMGSEPWSTGRQSMILARDGADIVIIDRSRDGEPFGRVSKGGSSVWAQDVSEEVSRIGRKCISARVDLSDTECVQGVVSAAVSMLGHLDIVAVDATVLARSSRADELRGASAELIDTELAQTWALLHATIPYLRDSSRGGSIVLTSRAQYGIVGLVRTLARELRPMGIRVNCVRPSAMRDTSFPRLHKTAGGKWATHDCGPDVGELAGAKGCPDDVASRMVAFLASDRASDFSGMVFSSNRGELS